MESTKTLNTLRPGGRAKVVSMSVKGIARRRLQDIGIIDGTQIECVLISPAGDPAAYLIRGAVIALRAEESSRILVEYL